ncbi:tRNA (adenosine(37)-N6)-threonylcarbamoyltransferase complex dimerization subunit type 1 TsaB [Qipengyuania gaetbuli]|uniref:tRNA (adenosine(37)-N6)-threonylcarbamoyltransferase complex dimerization subunit type 1 TsaB n=1 Tax=Qipengyuania gaetbuli TaxID=266952 RepID=UPI001CD6CB8D|nr:tRNA (adenosine(37)-N6)-threonylcarbamoyltransferase complex dimerization subunit type 1 TsaB [Qipengyuania gaetbuli]MCA0909250.1 tRNA (adenosine(37)-N6)-threonylcarbamoyltransferase complex dimerization subunit type 1 TsaB [Qipengyuania gaetbuli]
MRMLAIETATEACSVALFEDGDVIGSFHETIGRGHAERLVPMIADLPGKGRADEIRVSLGPGSFTGVRIGLATARALGVAWGTPVRGYPTLALVAAMAQAETAGPITVCMNGGHGEWFLQEFAADGLPETEVRSLVPDEARLAARHPVVAGNRAAQLVEGLDGPRRALDILPDARGVGSLGERLLTDRLSPIYGRPPDAKLPGA